MSKKSKAFTIVEIITVVTVIGILAALTVVSYAQVTKGAREKSVAADAAGMRTALVKYKADHGVYPASLDLLTDKPNASSSFQYTAYGSVYFCVVATQQAISMFVSSDSSSVQSGSACTAPSIQTISKSNCPTTRTMVKDARDNHTYWIQKLADGQCWMLTNLAYAGGGTNTYSDTIPTGDGTNGTLSGPDNSGSTTYTSAKYYIPTGANPTTSPTEPSTSTDGGTTGTQYGYLYNWCAAMGAQTGTDACSSTDTTDVNTSISICPAGWRLPTGGSSGGEFTALNTAINSGSTSTDKGLRENWFAQRSGNRVNGFYYQGSYGYYWSSSQGSATGAYGLVFGSSYVYPANYSNKIYGLAVRCVAR